MHTTLRKIGNSRGIIIPSALIEQLHIENEVELILQDNAIILRAVNSPRNGWFENYDVSKDVVPLSQMQDLKAEQDEWEW